MPPCTCACVRLGSMCGPNPPAMPSDIVWWWDACEEPAGFLPEVAVPLSAVVFERGGLVGPPSEVEYGGADFGVGGTGELGCELGYRLGETS